MDASTARDASTSKRPLDENAELMLELEKALTEPQLTEPPEPPEKDCVIKYHEMMRRALVDWGDEVIDAILKKCNEKHIAHVEAVRRELVDPLRKSLL